MSKFAIASTVAFASVAQAQQMAPATENIPNKPAPIVESDQIDADRRAMDEAFELIRDGKPAEAMRIADGLIARFEARPTDKDTLTFSARSMTEAILYSGIAASKKRSSVLMNESSGEAYFVKGFALVDLGRADEAKPYFDKAIALAPMNAQYLAERGEWYKSRKDWAHAYEDYELASSAAEFSPDSRKNSEKARALRGLGFVRIEQGELKEAERLYKESLRYQPDNAGARSELGLIKSLKSK